MKRIMTENKEEELLKTPTHSSRLYIPDLEFKSKLHTNSNRNIYSSANSNSYSNSSSNSLTSTPISIAKAMTERR